MLAILAAAAGAALFALILWAAGRPRAKHRSWRRATTPEAYVPRHLIEYRGRHEVVAAGPAVLGAHPDGGLALVHADVDDEPTDDDPTVVLPALIGAAA